MGRIASLALVREWRDRIERWQGSACGIGEFCRREGVSQASFYQWRRRLKTAVTERPRPGRAGDTAPRPRFIQLPQPDWPPTSAVQIALPGGAIVTLASHTSAEMIAAVVRAAMPEDRPC